MSQGLLAPETIQSGEKNHGEFLYRTVQFGSHDSEGSSTCDREDLGGVDPEDISLDDVFENWNRSGRITVRNEGGEFCPGFSYSAGDAASYATFEFGQQPGFLGVKVDDDVVDNFDYVRRGQRVELHQVPLRYVEGIVVSESLYEDAEELASQYGRLEDLDIHSSTAGELGATLESI